VLVRTLFCGLLLAAVAAPAAAQPAAQGTTTTSSTTAVTQDEIVLQGDTTPRPALPTNFGDTGLWFVPTAETLPGGRFSFSAYRANTDLRQGLTDVSEIGITGAIGLGDRVELFGSWRLVRLDRNLGAPGTDADIFSVHDPAFGGVAHEYPYLRRSWSETLGGPFVAGAKFSLISQSRGDAMSLAPRLMVKFPTGSTWSSTNDIDAHLDLVASREFAQSTELTAMAGAVLRGDSDEFRVSDGVSWGLGATFPSRSRLRALVEYHGEFVIKDDTLVINPPFLAEDGSVAPVASRIYDPKHLRLGGVFQASNGLFLHAGAKYSVGTGDRSVVTIGSGPVLSRPFTQTSWGFDIRLGWHPGVTPVRERVRVIKETTTVTNTVTPPPAAAAPNRNPTVSAITANPPVVEPGGTTNLSATATDPDGDPLTFLWSAPQGTFSNANALNTIFTAPNVEGNIPVTLTVSDNRGGTATSTITIPVVRRVAIMFEDVHFDFDRFNLRPEALAILDDAVTRLQANPELRVTIEGHCDSIGTVEYNLALGERRANSVRDYLVSRGIAPARLNTVSYGEERPIADNSTAAGRAMNRRAHLAVVIQ
jgi:peptidoglycan-associated lipoprotein